MKIDSIAQVILYRLGEPQRIPSDFFDNLINDSSIAKDEKSKHTVHSLHVKYSEQMQHQ